MNRYFFKNIKRVSTYYFIIIAYYTLTSCFIFYKNDSFIKDIFVAPLYFLVPCGVGLLIINIIDSRNVLSVISKVLLFLTSTFVGLVVITLIYYTLNSFLLQKYIKCVFPIILICSFAGFLKNPINIDDYIENIKYNKFFLCLILIFFIIIYYIKFIHFSKYPVINLFQDVHFFKGAIEFTKYKILNRANANSYIPIIQVNAFILNSYYNFNLINFKWIMPGYFFLYNMLCIYCCIRSITCNRNIIYIFLLISAILYYPATYTNGDLLFYFSLLLFSHIIFFSRQTSDLIFRKSGMMLFLFSTPLLILKLINFGTEYHNYFTIIIFYSLLIYFISIKFNNLFYLAFILFLVIISFPVHRAIFLFFPIVYVLVLFYFFTIINNNVKYVVIIFSSSLIIFIVDVIINLEIIFSNNPVWIQSFINFVYKLVLNKKINFNNILDTGGGVKNAFFEWLRAVPPIVYALIIFFIILIYLDSKKRDVEFSHEKSYLNQFLMCISLLLFICSMTFNPIPFTYRGSFYAVLVIIFLMSILICYIIKYELITEKIIKTTLVLLILYSFFSFLFYLNVEKIFYNRTNLYLKEFIPLNILYLSFLICSLGIIVYTNVKQISKWRNIFLIIVSVFAIFIDCNNIRHLFFTYSYGSEFPDTKVISHYSQSDFILAKEIYNYNSKTVLFSDPSTIGIYKAFSGFNCIYDTVNIEIEHYELKKMVQNIINTSISGTSDHNCSMLNESINLLFLHKYTFCNEAVYTIEYRMNTKFDYDNIKHNLLFIFNSNTFKWAKNQNIYFPDYEELSADKLKILSNNFIIVKNIDNKIILAKLK